MSRRYKGAVISATPPTTTGGESGTAPGEWTLQQQAQAQGAGLWPLGPQPKYIEDMFSTYLITGAGTSYTINNGIDLSTKGGMTWLKRRNAVNDHEIFDTVRGAGKGLVTNDTVAQFNDSLVDSFTTTGFTGSFLTSGSTNVAWTFRKQPKFFDVVTYTGNGTAGKTVAHSLGSTPGCIIVKRTDAAGDWMVYHRGNSALGVPAATVYERLNTAASFGIATVLWNDTAPTDTNFTLGTFAGVNANGGTYVAYIFAHDAGGFGLTGTDNVISCGTFTMVSNVASVTLGYEPQWTIIKPIDVTGAWMVNDVMRGATTKDGQTKQLWANLADAEASGTAGTHPTATGFTVQGLADGTYIYIAIRKGPMKVPTDATKVYNAVARTGTSATATITGVGFSPDLVTSQDRGSLGAQPHWQDRLRGPSGSAALATDLRPNSTNAETSRTEALMSINMDGVTIGSGVEWNYSGEPFVNYFFKRAPSFFDEVCYTGTNPAQTINHNLNAVPELMIIKRRLYADNWAVYSAALGNQTRLILNTTDAQYTPPTSVFWNSTTPTATTFTVGTFSEMNGAGNTFVAYLFATCPGVSKVGSYTGTGATQTISCGFAGGARFVLVKRTDSTGDWYVWDTARGMVSGTDPSLLWNSNSAEVNANSIYTTTGGFQIVSTAAGINASGGSYIFLAIA